MPGSPPRDLAVLDHWSASLERSRARRARSSRRYRTRAIAHGAMTLTSLLDARSVLGAPRDLADEEPWQLSLGRSRARRRAVQLRFVPTSSRAKRMSLGALVALSVGPTTAALTGGGAATASAAANPEPTTTTEHVVTLSAGSEGRQVRLLQKALGIKVDGVFGPETEAAVRAFQSSKGLSVDGIVGPRTTAALRGQVARKAMMSDFDAPVPGQAAAEASTSGTSGTLTSATVETTSAADGATGAEGSTSAATPTTETVSDTVASTGGSSAGGASAGTEAQSETGGAAPVQTAAQLASEEAHMDAVKQLQIALHLNVDGDFGPETEAAVKRLQARNGLSATGVVDAATWAAIGVQSEEPLTPPATAEEAVASSASSTVRAVDQLQNALHLPVTGEFNAETESAVRTLQARNDLTVDGIVGPQTWAAIGASDEETLTPPPSALPQAATSTAAATDTGLTAGSGGTTDATPTELPSPASAVQWLQAALHLPVDGEFGPETEAAVKRLQARHGLTVDGVVGPQTWAVIGVQDAPTLTPPASALVETAAGGAGDAAGPGAASPEGEGEAAAIVARVIAAANEIATRPYVYGGGHGSFESEGYDCSGSVSYALHGGGLLSAPEDSTELESYGEPGPGKYITIYANAEHAYMVIDGKRFDTVALAEDGTRWSDSPGDDGGSFVERHPAGL
jgi:peptidoglycan hydrolase-like protein with peptidoglycan-binding domain